MDGFTIAKTALYTMQRGKNNHLEFNKRLHGNVYSRHTFRHNRIASISRFRLTEIGRHLQPSDRFLLAINTPKMRLQLKQNYFSGRTSSRFHSTPMLIITRLFYGSRPTSSSSSHHMERTEAGLKGLYPRNNTKTIDYTTHRITTL